MNANRIEIKKIIKSGNRIEIYYDAFGDIIKYFGPDKFFWAEYDVDITNVPDSICVVPLMGTLLTFSWLFDVEISVEELDKDFYESIPKFKDGYCKMYPKTDFKGTLKVGKVVENQVNAEKEASLFSGGVDAFHTYLRHKDTISTLISVWGADIHCHNDAGWSVVKKHLDEVSEQYNTENTVIRSNFRTFIGINDFGRKVMDLSGDGWWHGFQSGTGMLTLTAPLAYMKGIKKIYIASSFTYSMWGKYTCSSDPIIDNYIKFCNSCISHDGYESARQDKINWICKYASEHNEKISLRVCWESDTGSNCCKCEKCLRTMLGIYSEKQDPLNFGFAYKSRAFKRLMKKLKYKPLKLCVYIPIQKRLKENYSTNEVIKSIKWFYKINLDTDEMYYQHKVKEGYNLRERLFYNSPVFLKKIYHLIKK